MLLWFGFGGGSGDCWLFGSYKRIVGCYLHMKEKLGLVMIFVLVCLSFVSGAMYPDDPASCTERGYELINESCVFPDGNKCDMYEFVVGICGAEYKTEDYCVEEGRPVWDKNECCEGTIAYLKPGMAGQAGCQDISIFERVCNQIKYGAYVWILGIIVLVILVAIYFMKKRRGR